LYKQAEEIEPKRRISTKEFLEKVFTALKERIKESRGFVSWDDFASEYPKIVLEHGEPFDTREDYKKLFLKSTFGLDDDFRVLDRDVVGDDLYNEIYKDINVKALLKELLIRYAEKNNGVVPRETVELMILTKINSNISEKDKNDVLKDIFEYDPTQNEYRVKKSKQATILDFAREKTAKPKPQYIPLPHELALSMADAAKYYGGHSVKHASQRRGDKVIKISDLIVEVNGTVYYVIINDRETAIRLLNKICSQDSAEREKAVVLYIYYKTLPNDVKSYGSLVKPAKMLAVPYDKHECVVEAFKTYDPGRALKEKCEAEEL